ncbi:MAG: argininosuccinate lyase, partial [Armatimonadota bacterium]
AAEDIHMNVEMLLHQRIGSAAGRLHTARSRNDQVALDFRMYVRAQITEIIVAIRELQQTFIEISEQNLDTVMPGYTHLQHAQPVTLAHHLLAYFWMLQRDRERYEDAYKRVNVMPLGSGALAGTSFPIDREYVAELLGFAGVTENSMDAVSDRDFALEFLSVSTIIGMHLSRFAEEIIIWNTREFGFVELDDAMATGSSLMPQKKNPDVAELIRGKSGRLYGNLITLLTVMKGLPLAYNKDMQEDKEPVFDTADTIMMSLQILKSLLETTDFRADVMSAALKGDFSDATDLADFLVRQGVPFRVAHEISGTLVHYCMENKKTFSELTLEELKVFSDKFVDTGVTQGPIQSVNARNVAGSTSPEQMQKQLQTAKEAVSKG